MYILIAYKRTYDRAVEFTNVQLMYEVCKYDQNNSLDRITRVGKIT